MKLHIIQPTHYLSPADRALHKTKKRSVINLTLPYLAALTPEDSDVTLIDEQVANIDFSAPVDVVAITTWTMNSIRAYEIADRFRERGVTVLMGGPHTFFHEEEAAAHCDAVGSGEGETIWPQMLSDAASGKLKKIYRADKAHDLQHLAMPRYDLIDLKQYDWFKTYSVQTSRGCPFRCEFCSERLYLGQAFRYRPTQDVIDEIKYTKAGNFLFADSNFAGNVPHAMELMEALIPLRVRWSALWSIYLCGNERFLDLARQSGLLHVNIGMESISADTLASMNKKINKVSEYGQFLRNLSKRGISYSLNFIFGWDTDDERAFISTLNFLMEHKVPAAYFNILMPDKGTALYDRMKETDRLINIESMGRWPGDRCYIKPKKLTPEALERGVREMYAKFYSYSSMISRLPLPVTMSNIASWVINFSQRKVGQEDSLETFDDF
jgi:radical SAM superfamily enzyme YgiQ (UPF0313 family)